MRAIAALMVVVHHARHYFEFYGVDVGSWSTFGSRGVDIFFVISGFVMAYSTRGISPGGACSAEVLDFLVKRFIRVVPLYWITLGWAAKGLILAGTIGWGLLGDFLFIPRFHPEFHDKIYPLLVPGWTINYEVFFYLTFALAMYAGAYRYLVLSAVFGVLSVLGAVLVFHGPVEIFYSSSVILEFLLGVVIYKLHDSYGASLSRSVAAFVLLVSLSLMAIENGGLPRVFADGPFAAIAVFAALVLFDKVKIGSLRIIGDASYSIYLCHLFIFEYAARLCARLDLTAPSVGGIVMVLLIHTFAAIFCGVVIHKVVEKPVLSSLQAIYRRRVVLAAA